VSTEDLLRFLILVTDPLATGTIGFALKVIVVVVVDELEGGLGFDLDVEVAAGALGLAAGFDSVV